METLDCLALSRPSGKYQQWLVANGMNMGRWTFHFGVNCLADTCDCKAFVRNIHEGCPNSSLHKFKIAEEPA